MAVRLTMETPLYLQGEMLETVHPAPQSPGTTLTAGLRIFPAWDRNEQDMPVLVTLTSMGKG